MQSYFYKKPEAIADGCFAKIVKLGPVMTRRGLWRLQSIKLICKQAEEFWEPLSLKIKFILIIFKSRP